MPIQEQTHPDCPHPQYVPPPRPPRVHDHHHRVADLQRAPQLPPVLQPRLIEAQPPLPLGAKAALQAVAPRVKGGLLQRVQLLGRAHDALGGGGLVRGAGVG